MKKIGVLSVIAIMGMSSVYAADYRASINNAIPKSNVGFQWNNFTKMTGVKWDNPQPKASPKKNADGTLDYYMHGDFKRANKKQETAYIRACPYLDNEAKNRLNRQQNKANCADNIGILSNNLTQFCQI